MDIKVSDMKMCWCIIISLIVVLFIDNILNSFPILKTLFTDNTNYILLVFLIIFTMLIDLYCGIIIGLLVIYISMYINTHHPVISNKDKNNKNNKNDTNNNIFKHIVNSNNVPNIYTDRKVQFNKEETIITPSTVVNTIDNTINNTINSINNSEILSDSEFIYNNTKPFPNKNLKPFQTNVEEPFIDINSNTNSNTNTNTNKNYTDDFITHIGEPDRSGFDISGCRYDMKNSPQNLTKYGPPLAQCSAYDTNKVQTCGTLFYPLNA